MLQYTAPIHLLFPPPVQTLLAYHRTIQLSLVTNLLLWELLSVSWSVWVIERKSLCCSHPRLSFPLFSLLSVNQPCLCSAKDTSSASIQALDTGKMILVGLLQVQYRLKLCPRTPFPFPSLLLIYSFPVRVSSVIYCHSIAEEKWEGSVMRSR